MKCPLCYVEHSSVEVNKDNLRLVACLECGLRYLDPQPSESDLKSMYDSSKYFGVSDVVTYPEQIKNYKPTLYARRIWEIRKRVEGRKLMEIGCGTGFFLKAAAELGWEVSGIELSSWAASYAVRELGLNVLQGDFLQMAPQVVKESFDVVIAWDVLEHVPDPLGFVQGMKDLTRPGGLVSLSTLNLDNLPYLVLGPDWRHLSYEHLIYPNVRTLLALLTRVGLSDRLEVMTIGEPRHFRQRIQLLGGGRAAQRRESYYRALAPLIRHARNAQSTTVYTLLKAMWKVLVGLGYDEFIEVYAIK